VRVTPISLLACELAGSPLVLDEHLLTEGAHDRDCDGGGELTEIILFREWQLPGSHFRPVSDGCWPEPAFRSEPSLLMTDAAWWAGTARPCDLGWFAREADSV